MVRPRTARREILTLLKEGRAELEADSFLKRYHKKLVLRYFDVFSAEIELRLKKCIIFARPQWNICWNVQTLIFMSSRLQDRCQNTAAMKIAGLLRVFGLKHGFIKNTQGEYDDN